MEKEKLCQNIDEDHYEPFSTNDDKPSASVKSKSFGRGKLNLLVLLAVAFIVTAGALSVSTLLLLGEEELDAVDLMCFKCEEDTFTTWKTKHGRCCIDKKELFHDLVGKQKTGLIGNGLGNMGRHIGAHKHLEINTPHKHTNLPDFSRSPYPLSINTRNDYLEYSNGVELSPEGIRVLFPGLYFVYMSVYFQPDKNHHCSNFEPQTFYGKLLRKNPTNGQIDELMSSEHTCCPECRFDRESAFTGGMFYLNEGDIVEVTVSAYGVVYVSRDITFMGISMIGSSKMELETTTAKSTKQSVMTFDSTNAETSIISTSKTLDSQDTETLNPLASEKTLEIIRYK